MHSIFKLNPQLFTTDKAVIYGAGKSGKNLRKKLYSMGLDIHAFVDSDEHKTGTFCDEKIVYGTDWLKENKAACIIPSGYQEYIYMACRRNHIENLFLDFREGYELMLLDETCAQNLFVPADELTGKKVYILGTDKYSRRLFLLLYSMNCNIVIEGFLKYSLDKKITDDSIFNHKLVCPDMLPDENIAVLVSKSISDLMEYKEFSEQCYFEDLF